MIKKLAIFGVGLIGGSLALALKQKQYCDEIVGCSRNSDHLKKAVELGVIDSYCLDPEEAAKDADMIFLATPLRAMQGVMNSIKDALAVDAIVTDAGSSKQSVIESAIGAFGYVPQFFVPGHPIAGREKSGVSAALANLFVDHKVILTPVDSTSELAISKVSQMWAATGAEVTQLDVEQHDLVLAATSHLPHVVAYSLVDTISKADYVHEIFRFAAGGFRDSSRTASSDPVMWRDICLENRQAILDCVHSFQNNLEGLKNLIQNSDAQGLLEFFDNAKKIRDANVTKSSP
ncbi:MAG: prephenate dehydrogenase/arogenate dehydrogenase family protein [Planctomycetota bacterium]